MEKAIATVIITVASIAAIMTVLNALMPAISRTNTSIVSAADSVDSRISTQLDIIEASGADSSPTINAWVKNDGGIEISPLDHVDVFFGSNDSFVRIPYGAAGCSAPCWSYTVENDTVWNPTATIHLSVSTDASLTTGVTYYVKVVAPNGIGDSRYFTV